MFFRYKLFIKRKFSESMMTEPNTERAVQMVNVVVQAIQSILQGFWWEPAFRKNGISADQNAVSSCIRGRLSYEIELPIIPNDRPTADLIRLCWPRNRTFDEELLMGLLPGDSDLSHPPAMACSGHSTASLHAATPMAGPAVSSASSCAHAAVPAPAPKHRLRSKTSLFF